MSKPTRQRALDSRGRPVPGLYTKNGNFIAGYNCPVTGRWTMKSLDAKDLSAAKRERESLLAGLREGRVAARNDSTVAGVFADWQVPPGSPSGRRRTRAACSAATSARSAASERRT